MFRFRRAKSDESDSRLGGSSTSTPKGCMHDDRNVTSRDLLAPKCSRAGRLGFALGIRSKRKRDRPAPSAISKPEPESSRFLTALPVELRAQIYLELMRPLGDAVHIFQRKGRFICAPCISEHGQDSRQDGIEGCIKKDERNSRYYYAPIWRRRLANPWSNHWRCEEETHGEISVIRRVQLARCVLPLLLTCKTM